MENEIDNDAEIVEQPQKAPLLKLICVSEESMRRFKATKQGKETYEKMFKRLLDAYEEKYTKEANI